MARESQFYKDGDAEWEVGSGKVQPLFVTQWLRCVMNRSPEKERILGPSSLLHLLTSGLYPYNMDSFSMDSYMDGEG